MTASPPLPRSVLFLCGMNAVRSPVAERLAVVDYWHYWARSAVRSSVPVDANRHV